MFSSVTIFHILKNKHYELCFLAGFFINGIMTRKKYDRKKSYYVSFIGSVGKQFLVLRTYLVYNTVVSFLLWFPPYLSCLQNNPPENNVEFFPAKSQPGYLRFGRNWPHIIFRQIVLEAAQIWRKKNLIIFWWIVFGITYILSVQYSSQFFCCGSRHIWAASKTIHWKIMWNFFPPNLSRVIWDLGGTGSPLFSGRLF